MDVKNKKPGGIYIHIPFCVNKCLYCDFYSITDLSLKSRYVQALLQEMQLVRSASLAFDTLYLGGGTPSVLDPAEIGQIIEAAFARFKLLPDAEITLEVNPGTVTFNSLRAFREIGINRLNIGIQSFQEANLKFLGRIHSAKDAILAYEWAHQAGFDNIGIDLIYGLPRQTEDNWHFDLKHAIQIRPDHLSCYMLTCEPGTGLHQDLLCGRYQPLQDAKVRALFDQTVDYLKAHGYRHYEISNFACKTREDKPPRMSRHNLKYWTLASYLGLGAAAHSFIEPQRYWNFSDVDGYIRKLEDGQRPVEGAEVLTPEQLITEAVFLGLRTIKGINLVAFKRKFGLDFLKSYKETISELENEGLLQRQPDRIALSRKGLAFLDSIVPMFTGQQIKVPKYGGFDP